MNNKVFLCMKDILFNLSLIFKHKKIKEFYPKFAKPKLPKCCKLLIFCLFFVLLFIVCPTIHLYYSVILCVVLKKTKSNQALKLGPSDR